MLILCKNTKSYERLVIGILIMELAIAVKKKYIYICLLLHCIYMAQIVEVSWEKFIFKPICSHVKVHFVMAVSYILQYHNKNTKISELHIDYIRIMIVYMWHFLDIPRL